jgi:hypothetical protein
VSERFHLPKAPYQGAGCHPAAPGRRLGSSLSEREPPLATLPDAEQDRQRLLAEFQAENDANWQEQYQSGSFGCHELLDRTTLVADMLEQHVLSHPACFSNAEWYALAEQAVAALRELYQRIGAEHLSVQDASNDGR